jgi:hypothetical protein
MIVWSSHTLSIAWWCGGTLKRVGMGPIGRDVWSYVFMDTLCRAISYGAAEQFQNPCRAIEKIDNNGGGKIPGTEQTCKKLHHFPLD